MLSGIITLNKNASISPQINDSAAEELKNRGYEQIICNRHDNEETEQVNFLNISQAAERNGLTALYYPTTQDLFLPHILEATQEALSNGKRTLMYCSDGRRCSILWAIAEIKSYRSTPEEAFVALEKNGFNIELLKLFILETALDSTPEFTLE